MFCNDSRERYLSVSIISLHFIITASISSEKNNKENILIIFLIFVNFENYIILEPIMCDSF